MQLSFHNRLELLLSSLGLMSSLYKPIPQPVDSLSVNSFSGGGDSILDSFSGPAQMANSGKSLPNVQVSFLYNITPTEEKSMDTTTVSEALPEAATTPLFSKTSTLAASDVSCAVEPYDSPVVLSQTFPPFDEAKANVYRYRQQQGVNLGSWFVHEQWMTPSLFTCASGKKISELDIASGWGSTTSARALLERHWDTFITADDFAYLASIGINTTPFEHVADVYQNSWARVVKAINMAADVSIGILVDLHGAVGSQNGQPHSGISDGQTNLFTDAASQDKTIAVLTFLTQQLATVTNVVGIQLLNEPQNVPQLTDFYTRTLETLRQVSPEAAKMPFYIHDGFDLQRFDDYISSRKDFVVQDHHSYFVFTPADNAESAHDHTKDITGSIERSLTAASQKQRNNLVIDEWSCALTPDSLAKEQDPELTRSQFCQGQLQVYQNSTAGSSFWSYYLEDCATDGGWCFKHAVGKYLPSTFFFYLNLENGSNANASEPVVLSALTKIQLPDLSELLHNAAQDDPSSLDTDGATSSTTAVEDSPVEFFPRPFTTSPALPSSFSSLLYAPGSSKYRKREHRFSVIHSRRSSQPGFFDVSDTPTPSATQAAAVKGYSDGFLTAKIFAMYKRSKLGFVGQYIEDSLQSLGPTVIEPGRESYYREWFRKGLLDGELAISNIVLAPS